MNVGFTMMTEWSNLIKNGTFRCVAMSFDVFDFKSDLNLLIWFKGGEDD